MDKKGLKDVYVNFVVACSSCNKKQQTTSVGNSNGLAKAQIIGDAIERKHRQCQVTTAPQDPFLTSAAEIERLEKELGQQRRQMDEFQREIGQLKRTAEHKVGAGFTINAVEVHQTPSSEIRKDKQELEEYDSIHLRASGNALTNWLWLQDVCCNAGSPHVLQQSGYIVTDYKRQEDESWWDHCVPPNGTRGIPAHTKIAQEKRREIAEKLTKLGPCPNTCTSVVVQDRSA